MDICNKKAKQLIAFPWLNNSITRRASFLIFECLVKNDISKKEDGIVYAKGNFGGWFNKEPNFMNPVPAAAVWLELT